jgi:hypothetical protein
MPAAALRRSALIASVSIIEYPRLRYEMPGDASREVSAGHISAENHFLQSPRVIWCLAGSHPLLKPLPPVRIRRSEVAETLREITALSKSQPTLLHFRGSRLSALSRPSRLPYAWHEVTGQSDRSKHNLVCSLSF